MRCWLTKVRALTPKVMDFVQDRRGKVIWPEKLAAVQGLQRP